MSQAIQERLIELLKRDDSDLRSEWTQRLGKAAFFASMTLGFDALTPVRKLLQDFIETLEGKFPPGPSPSGVPPPRRELFVGQPLGLCRTLEVFQVGEVVVRNWARGMLEADDRELLEAYQLINHAFHQLIRYHSVNYCSRCRAKVTSELKGSREVTSAPAVVKGQP